MTEKPTGRQTVVIHHTRARNRIANKTSARDGNIGVELSSITRLRGVIVTVAGRCAQLISTVYSLRTVGLQHSTEESVQSGSS